MGRDEIEDRIAELNILLSAAQSLDEAVYLNRLILELEVQLDKLKKEEL